VLEPDHWAWRPSDHRHGWLLRPRRVGPQQALVDCPVKEIFFGGTRRARQVGAQREALRPAFQCHQISADDGRTRRRNRALEGNLRPPSILKTVVFIQFSVRQGSLRFTRSSIVRSKEMDPDIAAAITQISQGPNGEVRVRLHDKHAALVSIGKHLGMFTDRFKVDAVYGISEEPMSAEEWKKQFVKVQ
jgi:hypothetical protein